MEQKLNPPQTDIPQLRDIQEQMKDVAEALVRSRIMDDIPNGNKIILEVAKVVVLNDANSKSYLRGVLAVSSTIGKRQKLVAIIRRVLRFEDKKAAA